jgi:hypothetical protein
MALLPPADAICIELTTGPGELCVKFPGGATLCTSIDVDTGDLGAIIKGFMGELNAGMAGLAPFFTMLDVIVAIVDCVKAIKEAVAGTPPDPTKIVQCLPNLVEALDKLLSLHPALSIPGFIKSVLLALITGLQGLRNELSALIAQELRVAAAEFRGAELGNIQLVAIADCARNQLDASFVNLNASLTPMRRIMGLINALLKLANLPCIQMPIEDLLGISEEALEPIDAAIEFLELVRSVIPAPDLVLAALPQRTDPC